MNPADVQQKILQQQAFSPEEKSLLLSLLEKPNHWGLVWENVPDAAEQAMAGKAPQLQEVVERALQSPDENAPEHLLIEGDNLHALTALCRTHAGKVALIYIDPPYNTGNTDFTYTDHFADKEQAYPHSAWLSFMEKRLRLAKTLLCEEGALFISIDGGELAQLKLLADQLFGEQHFIDIFSWVRTETPARLSKKSLKVVEYVLAYQKSKCTPPFQGYRSQSPTSNLLLNQTNALKTLVFPARVVATGLPDGPVPRGSYGTRSYAITLEEDAEVQGGYFISPVKLTAKFKWNQKKLLAEISQGTRISIRTKTLSPAYEKASYGAGAPKNLIDRRVGVATNEEAKAQLADMGIEGFSYPKPVSLIKYLISFHPMKDGIVLDYMAGSGTTLHALMELNAEDGGRRRGILVTNNENKIAEQVCYERIRKAIQGYTKPKGDRVEGLWNNSLRYYTCQLVPESLAPAEGAAASGQEAAGKY